MWAQFLVVFLLTLPAVWVRLFIVGGKTDPLDLEGRYADAMPVLDARSFWHGDFQDDLEKISVALLVCNSYNPFIYFRF